MNNSASHHQGGLSKGRQGSARSAAPDLHSAHWVTRVTSTVYEEAGRARRGMERALTLFSLEMDICRFVQHGDWGGGVMIELIGGGRNFFYFHSIYFFIYLFLFQLSALSVACRRGAVCKLCKRGRSENWSTGDLGDVTLFILHIHKQLG